MRRLAAALVLLPVLSACTSPATPQAAAPVAEVGLGGVPVPVAPPPVDVPADEPVVEAGPDDPAVPPGDPGVDAPSAPEPAATEVHAHDEELPRRVPPSALLGAADLGPGWATARTPEGACAPRATGPSVRGALASDTGSTLVETVSVEADAVGAVAGWRRALEACGYAVSPLALGEAGIAADGDGERVLVTTSERVVVAVRARGPLAADPALPDWADLALGSSCPAAPDGCH